MDDIHVFQLRLSDRNQQHKKVLQILSAIPKGNRSAAVCNMIIQAQEASDLKTLISETIEKALSRNSPPFSFHPIHPIHSQHPPRATTFRPTSSTC
jgi:hypothetical protein